MLLGSIEYKEIKDTVQKDGEDNSEEGIDAPVNLRFVKGKAEHDADGGRRKHMEERGTHEAQIARHHGLDHRIARQRREEKEGILRRREAERDELARLGMRRVLAPPEPQPRESREEPSCHRRENGSKFTHVFCIFW